MCVNVFLRLFDFGNEPMSEHFVQPANYMLPGTTPAPSTDIMQDAGVFPPGDKRVGKYMDPFKWIDTERLDDYLPMWRHSEVSPNDDWAQSPHWKDHPFTWSVTQLFGATKITSLERQAKRS